MFQVAPGRKSLWIAPGLGHARTADISGADYKRRVLAFLHETIGDPR